MRHFQDLHCFETALVRSLHARRARGVTLALRVEHMDYLKAKSVEGGPLSPLPKIYCSAESNRGSPPHSPAQRRGPSQSVVLVGSLDDD